MDLNQLAAEMTPVEALAAVVGVLVTLSVAAERLVEIVKGIIPFLNLQNKDKKKEGWRKAILQTMAVGSGIIAALLARPALSGSLLAIMTVAESPSAASQKYSKEVNVRATSAKSGAEVIRTTAPIRPPMADVITSTPRTSSAFPCFVSS